MKETHFRLSSARPVGGSLVGGQSVVKNGCQVEDASDTSRTHGRSVTQYCPCLVNVSDISRRYRDPDARLTPLTYTSRLDLASDSFTYLFISDRSANIVSKVLPAKHRDHKVLQNATFIIS